jgi:ribose transport system permease protein
VTRPTSRLKVEETIPTPRNSVDADGVPTPTPDVAAAAPATAATPARRRGAGLWHHVAQYSLPILLLLSVLLYSSWGKTSTAFNTTANWQNMGASQAVTGVLTLGILVTLVSGNFDLSIGNICGLSSVMTAAAYSHLHVNVFVGVLVGVVIGAAVGGLNGFLTTTLRVDPFIVTLGTASVILGFIDWYTKGQSIINGIPQGLIDFGRSNLLGVPDIAWVLGGVALVIYYLLQHTPYGRSLHAIGSNRAAAALVGIRVERTITSAFMLTGAFAGVAGVLLLARTGAGNPQIGPTFTLTALASAFLGAVSFKVGRLNVPGTLVAIFFLAVNITGLTFAGVQNWVSEVFTGATLILAVALAAVLSIAGKGKRSAGATSTAGGTAAAETRK